MTISRNNDIFITINILLSVYNGDKIFDLCRNFSEIKEKFVNADVSDFHEHLAFQFNITGEGSGIFYVEVNDGKLRIEPYEYFDRDAIFICSADVLRKISEGEMDPVVAFTLQKLKVEGSIDKALRFKEIVDSKRKKK